MLQDPSKITLSFFSYTITLAAEPIDCYAKNESAYRAHHSNVPLDWLHWMGSNAI